MTLAPPIPSRESNPFATCWTRPGALPFVGSPSVHLPSLLARLRENQWRGQILGPHGCGKSTLLRSIEQALIAANRPCVWLRAGRDEFDLDGPSLPGRICLIDSFECLSRWQRWRWRRQSKRVSCGLIVTAHTPAGLPTLASLSPALEDVLRCYRWLTSERESPVTPVEVRNAFDRRRGNVREIWFDLYDRHERLTRRANPNRRAAY